MDLTFQVTVCPVLFLEHQTLLLSPVTSTTGHCFPFGSISSFCLEYFSTLFPVAYWSLTDLGFYLSVLYLFAFHTAFGVLKARILKWFTIPFSNRPCFVRPLHHDHDINIIYSKLLIYYILTFFLNNFLFCLFHNCYYI